MATIIFVSGRKLKVEESVRVINESMGLRTMEVTVKDIISGDSLKYQSKKTPHYINLKLIEEIY